MIAHRTYAPGLVREHGPVNCYSGSRITSRGACQLERCFFSFVFVCWNIIL